MKMEERGIEGGEGHRRGRGGERSWNRAADWLRPALVAATRKLPKNKLLVTATHVIVTYS